MKRLLFLALTLLAISGISACSGTEDSPAGGSPTPTPTPTSTALSAAQKHAAQVAQVVVGIGMGRSVLGSNAAVDMKGLAKTGSSRTAQCGSGGQITTSNDSSSVRTVIFDNCRSDPQTEAQGTIILEAQCGNTGDLGSCQKLRANYGQGGAPWAQTGADGSLRTSGYVIMDARSSPFLVEHRTRLQLQSNMRSVTAETDLVFSIEPGQSQSPTMKVEGSGTVGFTNEKPMDCFSGEASVSSPNFWSFTVGEPISSSVVSGDLIVDIGQPWTVRFDGNGGVQVAAGDSPFDEQFVTVPDSVISDCSFMAR